MPQRLPLHWLAILTVTVAVALAIEFAAFFVLRRAGQRSALSYELYRRCQRPSVVFAAITGVALSLNSTGLPPGERSSLSHITTLALIAAAAWIVVSVSFVGEDLLLRRWTTEAADNLLARKKRTQIVVFNRITVAVVGVIAAAAMLTTFRQVRALGASLLASAGIAGLAAGVAAKPTLGNLVAGLQIAFTEPIRLDDVVVVEGEWGRVEEITLTYVVVRLWDTRRLVVPISYFVEQPFQNWTRSTSDLIGSAIFHFDYRVPLDEVRREFESIVATSSRWDRRIAVMQVTDTTHHSIEVRALVSAPDSATAFDLRCEVRERLVSWLQANHPEALPRMRTELVEAATPASPASPASAASPAFVGRPIPNAER